MGNVTQQVVGECVGWEPVHQTETGKHSCLLGTPEQRVVTQCPATRAVDHCPRLTSCLVEWERCYEETLPEHMRSWGCGGQLFDAGEQAGLGARTC